MGDPMLKKLARCIVFAKRHLERGFNSFNEDYEYPEQINVEVSTACNFDCKMCSLQQFHPNKTLIDPKIFTKLDDVLRKVNSLSFGFTGETLLHKDLVKIITYVKKRYPHLHTSVTTNASLLTQKTAQALIDLEVNHLSISLDGTNKKTFEKIRRGGKWEKVMDNIARLDRLKREQNARYPELATNFVALKDNIHELDDFITLIHGLGFNSLRLTNAEPYTRDIESKVLFGDNYTQEIKDIIHSARARCKELDIHFSTPRFTKKKKKRGCDFLEPYITLTGDVVPCGQFTYERTAIIDGKKVTHPYVSFGNIYNDSFDDIFYGKKYTEFRKKLKRGDWPNQFCKRYCLLNDEVLCPK